MNKSWDKGIDFVPIWKEVHRIIKPGGWLFCFSSPRADLLESMIRTIREAGFRVDFTPIFHAQAQGFPKARNLGKFNKKLEGQYSYSPKPAVEVIIIALKGFGNGTYTNQAIARLNEEENILQEIEKKYNIKIKR